MGGGGDGGGPAIQGSRTTKGRASSKRRSPTGVGTGLMLASMLDILMAILFFLMKNYSAAQNEFNMGKDITLPSSSATVPPMPALQLVVTQKNILLDNNEVGTIINGDVAPNELYKDGVAIIPLMQALKKQKDRSLYIQSKNDTNSFTGAIVMQADKNLKFSVLKKVIYTAGVSDFVMLKLAVLKRDE